MKIEQAANIFYIHYTKINCYDFSMSNILLRHYYFHGDMSSLRNIYTTSSIYGVLRSGDLIHETEKSDEYWSEFQVDE